MRIKWLAFFIPWGYWVEGWFGAALMAGLFGFIIVIGALTRRWAERRQEEIASRRTAVRIQKPKVLIMGLRVGGKMQGMGWKDVTVEIYDTYPEKALERALEEYDGYRIAAYQELDRRNPEPSERGWITVDPERDLPDE